MIKECVSESATTQKHLDRFGWDERTRDENKNTYNDDENEGVCVWA